MKPFTYVLILTILITCLPVFADDDDDSGIDRQKIYHINNELDLIPKVNILYYKPRIMVKATYPFLQSFYADDQRADIFNQLVSDALKEAAADFRKQVADKRAMETEPNATGRYDLIIDFDSATLNTTNHPIVSIRFTLQGKIAGMKRAYHYHRVLNVDLDNGTKIELMDLFKPSSNYLDFFSTYSQTMLDKKLRDKKLIIYGTEARPENYTSWNLNPNGLLITFDTFQVAPYVHGTQTVLIPYASLKEMLMPGSFLSDCMQHRTRCLRNNVLTGGFIDEA